MVPGQPVIHVVAILYGLAYRALGHNLGIFVHQPLLEGDHDWIGEPFPQLGPFFIGQVLVIGLPFNLVEQSNLPDGVLGPLPVVFQRVGKFPARVGPTTKRQYPLLVLVHFIYPVTVGLQGATEVFQQCQRHLLCPEPPS